MNDPLDGMLANFGIPKTNLPMIAGSYSGAVVVCGGARCLWDDLERLGCASKKDMGSVAHALYDFMTVNSLGETFPGFIAHWFSNSPREIKAFANARRSDLLSSFDKRAEKPTILHTMARDIGDVTAKNPIRWPWPGHGSSGLNAVYTALGLGYREVILAGIPSDDSGHYFDPPWRETNFEIESPMRLWERAQRDFFCGAVKSMSGKTREVVGGP